jgi:hypothetical protein
VRVEQPDIDYPVLLYIGADDFPVGIKFTAPISGEIEARIRLVLGAAGDVAPKVTYTFKPTPTTVVEPALRVAHEASRALERVAG